MIGRSIRSGRSETTPDARLAHAVSVPCALLLGAVVFALGWFGDGRRPHRAVATDGWWVGFDQAHYLLSARSFASANLSPEGHWYLPLYPILASPFVGRLADPFLPVDVVCFLLCIVLTGRIGRHLAPDWRWAGEAAMAAFLASLAWPSVLQAWIMPWSSTLAAPLMMGSLLATLQALRQPERTRLAAAAGLCGALVGGCRPADAMLLLAVEGLAGGGVALLAGARTRRPAIPLHWAASFGACAMAGSVPTLLLYLAIWGPHLSLYLQTSEQIGFDWRLLPLRWVEIMIDPKPLLPEGPGIIERMPFVATGLLGMLVLPVRSCVGRDRVCLAQALTAAALASSMALYLSYRDLHAPGLWQFYNIHYFKWCFGLLAFSTVLLARMVWHRPTLLMPLLALAAAALAWRIEPVVRPLAAPMRLDSGRLAVTVPSLGEYDGLALAASGAYGAIYFGPQSVEIGGRAIPWLADVKAFPIVGGLMLQPLRRWPAGLLQLGVRPGIRLDGDPILLRTEPVFGLPCWFGQSSCKAAFLPPPVLDADRTMSLAEPAGERFLGQGWWYREPGGHWSARRDAVLRFRLPEANHPGVLLLSVQALATRTSAPLDVTASAAGRVLAHWSLQDGSLRLLSVPLPVAVLRADGAATVSLSIDAPRRPAEIEPGSRDERPLGLLLRSLRWNPDAGR